MGIIGLIDHTVTMAIIINRIIVILITIIPTIETTMTEDMPNPDIMILTDIETVMS